MGIDVVSAPIKMRTFKLLLAVVGIVSLASAGAIILFVSPPNAGGQGAVLVPLLFSLSLFLFTTTILTYAGLFVRKRFITEENKQRIFTMAFREALLLALLGIAYLWFMHFGIFSLLSALGALAIVLVIEYYFLTH